MQAEESGCLRLNLKPINTDFFFLCSRRNGSLCGVCSALMIDLKFYQLIPCCGDLDLKITLDSGQRFDWYALDDDGFFWEGNVGGVWALARILKSSKDGKASLEVGSQEKLTDSRALLVRDFFQLDHDPAKVLDSFPDDPGMNKAVEHCKGLRLLRQDPWECLAAFILSSTKRIDQIRELVQRLSKTFGDPLIGVPELKSLKISKLSDDPAVSKSTKHSPKLSHTFPTPMQLSLASEGDLRALGLGFRAPYLLNAARRIADDPDALAKLRSCGYEEAKLWLTGLNGVGSKIADCVLLFAYGYQEAFPLDVWMQRILRHLYFQNRQVSLKELDRFQRSHFKPWAGYAQQFLFHAARTGVFKF